MTDYAYTVRIGRHITRTLFAAQALGSAGFIAVSTVNAIVGADLSGRPSWAGVPSAVYLTGAALSAFVWGHLMERIGRRAGLSLGLLAGVVGTALAATAIASRSFALFLTGIVLMGVAQAALQLGRFAAAEVHPPAVRGRAISNVVLAGTVGAIFGPLLVGPTGRLALRLHLNELSGPFAVAFVLFALASFIVSVALRPEPRDVAREIARLHPEAHPHTGAARPIAQLLREPGVQVAIVAMAFGQMVMVMLMSITSLHMKGHDHALSAISLVISSHTFGMFAFSILSGRLADRLGRGPVILIGAATLALSGLLAPLSPDVLPLAVALFLLGLGWNFCYVGGSSLLADQLSPAERARTQGFNDLLIGLAAATGGLGSGVVFAAVGYGVMGLVGALAALVPFGLTLGWLVARRRLAAAV